MTYSPPTVTELGSVRDMTLTLFNKIGSDPDLFAKTPIVGSVVPLP